jgi:Protein of unknown function (DUF2442).
LARHLGSYQLWLEFSDGRYGMVDLSGDLWGEELAPLRDPAVFAELTLNEGLATLTWDRGDIDISPAYLYSKLAAVH